MLDSVRQKNNFNTIIKYDLDMVSYDYDYVSISITGNVDKDKDILETKFWINDYILTTLTKRIPKKKIIIDHIPRATIDLNYFKTIILLKYLNCDVETNILDIDGKKNYFKSGFQDIIDNNHLILYENSLDDAKNRIELEIDLKKAYNDGPICMVYFTCFLIEDFTYTTLFQF